jgi:protocatechuate 3,4-dioxygenase beta subunit
MLIQLVDWTNLVLVSRGTLTIALLTVVLTSGASQSIDPARVLDISEAADTVFVNQQRSNLSLFPDATLDANTPIVRGNVVGRGSGGQVTISLGFESGLEVGQQLSTFRNGVELGLIEVVEVHSDRSRCIADAPLEIGDLVQLRESLEINVTCIKPSGEAIEGVSVGIFRCPPNATDSPALVASGLTDLAGKLKLTPVTATQLWLYGTDLKIVAKKAGWGSSVTPVVDLTEDMTLMLADRPATLVGFVLDPAGKPVPNATVSLLHGNMGNLLLAKTNVEGKFWIRDAAPWNHRGVNGRAVFIAHDNFALTRTSVAKLPTAIVANVIPTAFIRGTVIDRATGQPLPNVLVTARGVGLYGVTQVRSDASGAYHLRLPADRYDIWAEANERVPIAIVSLEAIPSLTQSNADIEMVEGATVFGRVTDQAGKPLDKFVGIRVAHYGPARPRGTSDAGTKVAADGSYRLRVAPGKNYIYSGFDGIPIAIEIKDGEQREVNVQVKNR